ncbi:MAG: NTP transferase domain-containing protein [Micrococcales bacterium]|nr:NTP transferase domain-containing protein [Micrococcales bacterium]
MTSAAPTAAAIVLCGGTSRRFGGIDKTAQPLGSATVLDSLLVALPAHWPIVCVGVQRELRQTMRRSVAWTREDPPLAGPVAGIAAGLAALDDLDHLDDCRGSDADLVLVLAGDQPFAGEVAGDLVRVLHAAARTIDAVAASDDGRAQLLLCAYRRGPLAALLTGDVAGGGVYRTLAPLRVQTLAVAERVTLDVDAPADLAHARGLNAPDI